MVSLTTAPNRLLVPPRLVGVLNFPAISLPLVVVVRPRGCRLRQRPAGFVRLESCSFGHGDLKRRLCEGSWWCCWCKGWESEGDLELEAEILEFMKESEKPEAFPTKKELADAGRMDLAEAIVKKGGWLSLGWDLDIDNEKEEVQELDVTARDCDDEQVKAPENGRIAADCKEVVLVGSVGRDFQQRVVGSHQESNSFEKGGEIASFGGFSVSANSSPSPSSSGRSFEMEDEEETGIEGILSRLEEQRNLSFGIKLGEIEYPGYASGKYGADDSRTEASKDVDNADPGRSSRCTSGGPTKDIFNNSGGKFSHSGSVTDFDSSRSSLKPETWQSWSLHRAGFSDVEFEAAEISFIDNQMHEGKEALKDEILGISEGSTEALDKNKEISHNDVRSRLQQLELELSSALSLLRSKSEEYAPKEGHETSSDLHKLSDAWEFQENEIMKAQNRLRSIRAKLVVLEGKMALAIIDAQKTVEEKHKRIQVAHRALQVLRTTSIVWPNSASEVLLAGSFDGWMTQRKMEKSSTGIFSVSLKLYPGRYEIKFIVDGVWKTDPLRPIVDNNGYKNNLLIVT